MWCAMARPGVALGPGMLQYLSNGGKHATPLKKSQHDGAERSPELFISCDYVVLPPRTAAGLKKALLGPLGHVRMTNSFLCKGEQSSSPASKSASVDVRLSKLIIGSSLLRPLAIWRGALTASRSCSWCGKVLAEVLPVLEISKSEKLRSKRRKRNKKIKDQATDKSEFYFQEHRIVKELYRKYTETCSASNVSEESTSSSQITYDGEILFSMEEATASNQFVDDQF
ncbi:hypothetical protein TIFTF001_016285 [Ficus carica]|uniref:Uncharacterized protein n=1 Tax=Ficus carica TaxID=3494 RepID=A0AA88A7B1_FICCA|nr:hypothetical protein TIFTF001_016285 [Ficus carica]